MLNEKHQAQRFELKYRISAEIAAQIRDFVNSYLEYDENSLGKPGNAYPNHSIYLDSDDLRLHWDVINGNKNRFKLRLRFYDDDPAGPVFFEIKRRVNDAIFKRRCPVRREAVPALLAGQLPDPQFLLSSRPESLAALQEFSRLAHDLHASPRLHVCYLREAWVSKHDNSVRVTLDTNVRAAPHFTSEISTRIDNYVTPFEPQVILELKFTSRFPAWFRQMVEIFGTVQCGSAKYVDSVVCMGEERLQGRNRNFTEEIAVEKYLNRRNRRGSWLGSELPQE
jgi:hypothetical protein